MGHHFVLYDLKLGRVSVFGLHPNVGLHRNYPRAEILGFGELGFVEERSL